MRKERLSKPLNKVSTSALPKKTIKVVSDIREKVLANRKKGGRSSAGLLQSAVVPRKKGGCSGCRRRRRK